MNKPLKVRFYGQNREVASEGLLVDGESSNWNAVTGCDVAIELEPGRWLTILNSEWVGLILSDKPIPESRR